MERGREMEMEMETDSLSDHIFPFAFNFKPVEHHRSFPPDGFTLLASIELPK